MKTHLGHYEIVEELGRGGMGVVYKGYESALGRFVAIKELSPSLAHDPMLVERFLREARSMASLNDPHIIQVYFIGTDEGTGQPFFAMEYVEGDSLSGLLKREGKLNLENALKVMHQTAMGLATAHDKGVVHRDIKPGNLMLTPRGNVKIADFGIALATQDFAKKLTSTGEFVGTPGYLSPEICVGKTVDQRSDIFSLGIVLFEVLTGHVPFTEESPLGLMLEVVKAEIPDIRSLNDGVDAQAAKILAKMVAKDPADRYQNCHDLAEALHAHPLVAKGGTVKLNVTPVVADSATVVGAPTPASRSARVATPPPVVGRTGGGTGASQQGVTGASQQSAAPPPPPSRPSALERSREGSGGSRLALAIAAGLVLLLGGAAFAMKSTLMDYARGIKDGLTGGNSAYSEGVAVGKASNPIGSSQAASGEVSALSALESASIGESSAAADDVRTVDSALEVGSVSQNVDSASATAAISAATQSTADHATPQPQPQTAAVAQPQEQRRDTIAKAAPVRPTAPPPRVAVIALGDGALTGPARQRVEERLMDAGFDVLDSDLVAGIGGRGDLPGIFSALRSEASVVVVIRADGVGSQELQYYGQSSTLYTANLSVRSYFVPEKRALGPGFRERVDFTTLNADSKAEEAVRPYLSGLVSELSPYRRKAAG